LPNTAQPGKSLPPQSPLTNLPPPSGGKERGRWYDGIIFCEREGHKGDPSSGRGGSLIRKRPSKGPERRKGASRLTKDFRLHKGCMPISRREVPSKSQLSCLTYEKKAFVGGEKNMEYAREVHISSLEVFLQLEGTCLAGMPKENLEKEEARRMR